MLKNWPDLSSQAWVSRLWAQFNKLPEPLKDSFALLAQSMEKTAKSQRKNNANEHQPYSEEIRQV
jgi:hypothetical protein